MKNLVWVIMSVMTPRTPKLHWGRFGVCVSTRVVFRFLSFPFL